MAYLRTLYFPIRRYHRKMFYSRRFLKLKPALRFNKKKKGIVRKVASKFYVDWKE